MSTWIILGIAGLAIMAAIIAFLKPPSHLKYRLRPLTLEERLAAYPPGIQAVIIKANRKCALMEAIPAFCFGALLLGFLFWTKSLDNRECVRLLGYNVVYLDLLVICYLIPLSVFAMTLSTFRMGLKTIKTGYFPPLDSVQVTDRIAKKGVISRLLGVTLLLLPFLVIPVFFLGHYLHQGITKGDTQSFQAKLETGCKK